MTHVYALGHLLGRPDCAALADHGVAALRGRFRDGVNGGWWAQVGRRWSDVTDKTAYEHAFVVLAAASATAADRPARASCSTRRSTVLLDHFWDDEFGMVVEQWDESWTTLDDYRGVNANMHTRRGAARRPPTCSTTPRCAIARCGSLTRVVHALARSHDWRIPEHFDAHVDAVARVQRRRAGAPVPALRRHHRPLARVGSAGAAPARGPRLGRARWLLSDAVSLFDDSVREGWAVDGHDGFVYTVDWSGRPVVRERMHWVAAEATATAAALHEATGDPSYADWYRTWWQHIDDHFRDPDHGSWHHELSPDLTPSAVTWAGKPDTYHAYQATLLPRLPLAPTLARALADGALPAEVVETTPRALSTCVTTVG